MIKKEKITLPIKEKENEKPKKKVYFTFTKLFKN
jgi:hypothetical protein